MWDWLDPLTPIAAMPQILAAYPKAKLFFMGGRHPAGFLPPMATRAMQHAEALGLRGRSVIFNDHWVAYDERVNFLLEADVGLSAAGTSLETRYAFRTRLLDYFWARLPIVTTAGDDLSEQAARHNVGRVVQPGDSAGWAEAVIVMLDQRARGELRPEAFEALRQKLIWERVVAPLVRYCRAPYPADDRADRGSAAEVDDAAAKPAELLRLRRMVNVQAGQISELQETISAQLAHLNQIRSGRAMKMLNWIAGRLRRSG
jgi:hypothetical protein